MLSVGFGETIHTLEFLKLRLWPCLVSQCVSDFFFFFLKMHVVSERTYTKHIMNVRLKNGFIGHTLNLLSVDLNQNLHWFVHQDFLL